MGNTPSRRVTVVNEDSVGIVQVSESVVKRLKIDQQSKKHVKVDRNVGEEEEEEKLPSVTTTTRPYKPAPPPPMSAADAYSTTLEQRKMFNEEFRRAEQSWAKRFRELKKQNKELMDIAEDRFTAKTTELEENFLKRKTLSPVCPELQKQVETCYKSNVNDTLNCSKCVRDYMNCLDQSRFKVITSLT